MTSKMESLKESGESEIEKKFRTAMEEGRATAKEKSDELIDKYYDTLINAGVKNPKQMTIILALADIGMNFMKNMFAKIAELVTTVISTIAKAFQAAFNTVKDTFKSIYSGIARVF